MFGLGAKAFVGRVFERWVNGGKILHSPIVTSSYMLDLGLDHMTRGRFGT